MTDTVAVLRKFHDLIFFALTVGFAMVAGLLQIPTAYFLMALFAIGAAYVYLGFKRGTTRADRMRSYVLRLGEEGLTYTDRLGRSMSLRWDRLRRVVFARREASDRRPDLDDYLEEFWSLVDVGNRRIEVPIGLDQQRALLSAFRARLPLFNAALAEQAIRCRDAGRWLCWERPAAPAPDKGLFPRADS